MDGEEDFETLGADEMLYGKGVCIIEWSEKIRNQLPKKTIFMEITPLEDEKREITLSNWNREEI